VAETVVLFGEAAELAKAQAALAGFADFAGATLVDARSDLTAQVRDLSPGIVVLLPAPITDHERRVATVSALRRGGFAGRIVVAGSFLTERHDALAAGADLFFEPHRRSLASVIEAASFRPALAVDHPYFRYLFAGEWVRISRYDHALPTTAPAALMAATSCHADAAFWAALADYERAHPSTRCVVVEDDERDEVHAEALSSGVQPYVVLADSGLFGLRDTVSRLLRETWLAHVLTD
jgi:hypothetical protein